MDRPVLLAGTSLLASVMLILAAGAVTLEIDLMTEGEPVPGASVTFETIDGEPIEATATAETQFGLAAAPPEAPASGAPVTDGAGKVAVALGDEHAGKEVVAVIEKDGKVVKRHSMPVTQAAIRVEAFDPADTLLAIAVKQGETCRAGRTCPFEIAIENTGTGIYEGPLFIEIQGAGDWAGAAGAVDGWYCAAAGRGRNLCTTRVALEPRTAIAQAFSVALPRYVDARATCAAISPMQSQAGERRGPVVAALQLGLARAGFDAGIADGVMGRRTKAAIDAFAAAGTVSGAADSEAVLFEAIHGYPLARLARLRHGETPACQRLALAPQSKPRRATPVRSRGDDEPPRDSVGPALSIGIGIGLGILQNQSGRDRHHHRRHRD